MRTTNGLRVAALGAVLMLVSTADAADVYWENPGPLGAGQRAALNLVFDGTQPAGAVRLPKIPGISVLGEPSQMSDVSIINGRQSATLTYSFPVRAEREGQISIPAFDVETSGGTETVPGLAVEVGAATVPSARGGSAKLSDVVQARLTPSNMAPYAGEMFDVDMIVSMQGGRRGEVTGTPSWAPTGVTVEPWGEGETVRTQSGSGVRFRTRALAAQAGRMEIAPATQEVRIESARERVDPFASFGSFGGRGFGAADDFFNSFFGRAQTAEVAVESNAVQLDVRPLPAPAPADFSGAVGQFGLETTLTPAQPKTGEPVTWTVTLTGAGNWSALSLPARAVPTSLRTLQPKQRKQFAAGELFVGAISEDLVLVPNQPGDYALEPVRFTYFDPGTGRYETAIAEPPALHVTGAPIAPEPAAAVAATPAASADAVAPIAAAPAVSAPAAAPISGSATGRAPIAWTELRWMLAAPLALLAAYWIGLAVRRARLTDPNRPRREALARAHAAAMRARLSTTARQQVAALLDWQHAVAAALDIDLATPTTVQMRDRVGSEWRDVWLGSEQALYAPEHRLPAGWCEAALALCTRPRSGWRRRAQAKTAAARLATASLLALCLVPAADGDEPPAADPDPRAALRAQVEGNRADWIARYNLGVAEAEQGDAGRAFGETLAAFAYAPGDAAVRSNATAFAAKLPGVDPATAALLAGGIAAMAAPATWQFVAIGGVVLFSIGAALLLHRVYLRGTDAAPAATFGRPYLGIAIGVTALGLFGAATSAAALRDWGRLADPRAAVVVAESALRAVPTDAARDEQPRTVASGATAAREQTFLGWTKISLGNGDGGWVRNGDLVPLYDERA